MGEKQIKIGVMGSASGPTIRDPEARDKARELGREIARKGCMLINGACPGLPDMAAAGAKEEGGFVFGVSPAFSESEHQDVYGSPLGNLDMVLYSGMGFMERDIVNIRSADAVVIAGGGMGTLNEFTVAYEEMKPIGVLTGTGGIADHIPEIMAFCNRTAGPDRILYDDDPVALVRRLLEALATHEPPMSETDIGGEKEEQAANDARESAFRVQRLDRDKGKRKKADEEYD